MSETPSDGESLLVQDGEDVRRIIATKDSHLRKELDALCREPPLAENVEREAARCLIDLRTELWSQIRSFPYIEEVLAENPPLILSEGSSIPVAVTIYRRIKERQKNPKNEDDEAARLFASLHETYSDYMNQREKFAMANGRLLVKIAQQFQGLGDSLNDLIHSGMEGLYYAVDHFELRGADGNRFSTYAWPTIRGCILRSLDSSRTIQLKGPVITDVLALNRAEAALRMAGKECGPEALMRKLQWKDIEKVKLLLKARKKPKNINAAFTDDGGKSTSVAAFIEGKEEQPGQSFEARDEIVKARATIEEAVDRLMKKERKPRNQKKLEGALPLWLQWRQLSPTIARTQDIADHHSLKKGKVKEMCHMFQRQIARVLHEMAAEREQPSE